MSDVLHREHHLAVVQGRVGTLPTFGALPCQALTAQGARCRRIGTWGLCPHHEPRIAHVTTAAELRRSFLRHDGTVYVIGPDSEGPVKVGWTSGDGRDRLACLQTAHWQQLRLHHAVPGSPGIERLAHLALREHRLAGEWFDVRAGHALAAITHAVDFLYWRTARRPSVAA